MHATQSACPLTLKLWCNQSRQNVTKLKRWHKLQWRPSVEKRLLPLCQGMCGCCLQSQINGNVIVQTEATRQNIFDLKSDFGRQMGVTCVFVPVLKKIYGSHMGKKVHLGHFCLHWEHSSNREWCVWMYSLPLPTPATLLRYKEAKMMDGWTDGLWPLIFVVLENDNQIDSGALRRCYGQTLNGLDSNATGEWKTVAWGKEMMT